MNANVGFSWASLRFQKTWPLGPVSSWYVQLGGTPGSQYRASLNTSQDVSIGYQHTIDAGAFGGANRGRWYVEPGYSYYGTLVYGRQLNEIGLKAGLRLETKSFGVVDLYVIGSTAKSSR